MRHLAQIIPAALAAATSLATTASAFSTELRPLPISDMVRSGKATIRANTSFDQGDIQSALDGDRNTLARTPDVNPLVLTLNTRHPFKFRGATVTQAAAGKWSLEIAEDSADLENRTGSYQKVIYDNPTIDRIPSSKECYPLMIRAAKLTVERTEGDNYVHLIDWSIEAEVRLTSLAFSPDTIRPRLNSKVRAIVYAVDDQLNRYPVDGSTSISTGDPRLAQWSGMAPEFDVEGRTLGSTPLTASWKGLHGSTMVKIGPWSSVPVTKEKKVKVAVVLQDFHVPSRGGRKMSEIFGWNSPDSLVKYGMAEINSLASPHSRWETVERIDDPEIFTTRDKKRIPLDTLLAWYDQDASGNWSAKRTDRLGFDFHALLEKHDLCGKRNRGEIDEVWIHGHPWNAAGESRLAGEGAWNINMEPVLGTACAEKLTIYGFNASRDVASMLHSMGHKFESVMAKAYGRWWNLSYPRNNWEMFTTIADEINGQAAFGRIHDAPNTNHAYDDTGSNYVPFTGDGWSTYPQISRKSRMINCLEWGCTELGRLRWWFKAIPHYRGQTDGVLNNWWLYFTDFDSAVSLAGSLAQTQAQLPVITMQNFFPTYVGVPVQINVSAGSIDGVISRVLFWDGPELIGVDSSAPYSILWTPRTPGDRRITAEVFDTRGYEAITQSTIKTIH